MKLPILPCAEKLELVLSTARLVINSTSTLLLEKCPHALRDQIVKFQPTRVWSKQNSFRCFHSR